MYVHWLIILVAIEEKSEPFSSKCSRHLAIYQNSNESNLYKIPLCDGLQWLPHTVQSVLNQNKNLYVAAHENVLAFVDALLSEMRGHDNIETRNAKDSLFRIYRDIRFSKDKSPYKTYWAGHFKRATKKLRGGYYFQIGPGETM